MSIDLQKRNVLGFDFLERKGDPDGPTIILFHGFGADAYDLAPLSQVYRGAKPRPTWLFPHGPLDIPVTEEYSAKAWFPLDLELLKQALQMGHLELVATAFPTELTQLRKKIEALIAELNIPPSKLILGGFSQGAVLATEIALNSFERPLALLIFSGTLINKHDWEKKAHIQAGMPFFQSHGKDDPLLPFMQAQELEKLFLKTGLVGKLHGFEGGHEIPQAVLLQLNGFFKTSFRRRS